MIDVTCAVRFGQRALLSAQRNALEESRATHRRSPEGGQGDAGEGEGREEVDELGGGYHFP